MLEEFSVKSIALFGSVVRGEARPDSDVDIPVEFDPEARIGLFSFVHLKDLLSDLPGCSVDLVTPEYVIYVNIPRCRGYSFRQRCRHVT